MIRRTQSAFTLVELLFIVAIIAVLAAISVPNFLEAQNRAKIARVRTDMAATALAMNRYYSDIGAYPPNTPEARRYLDASLQNPIMDAIHTSAPADLATPWWPESQNEVVLSMGMDMDMMMGEAKENINGKFIKSPVLDNNSMQLTLLTTSVSYLGTTLSRDIFASRHLDGYSRSVNNLNIFSYINTAEVFAAEAATTSSPGLWGDHLTSSTFFYLASSGPDDTYDVWHPLSGPWTPYEATNGTISKGDIFHFEGRIPGFQEPSEDLRPDHLPETY